MKYELDENCRLEALNSEAFLTCANGDLLALNQSAAIILKNILAGTSPEGAANKLAKQFNVDEHETLIDVNDLLKTLVEHSAVHEQKI